MFEKHIHKLIDKHPWMSFEEAWLLMKWSYEKNKDQDKYHGIRTIKTLMGIDYGIYLRQEKEWLMDRIQSAKDKFSQL